MRVITTDRGSVFYQCGLSFTDACYRKYPTLPVWQCTGFTPTGANGSSSLEP
jgi:hypothetical protein